MLFFEIDEKDSMCQEMEENRVVFSANDLKPEIF